MKGSISNYLTAKVAAVVVGVDGVGRGGTAEAYKKKRKLIFKKKRNIKYQKSARSYLGER